MNKIMVTGCGTDVGKSVVSAVLATVLKADYWKPVQCGIEEDSDTYVIKTLLDPSKHTVHPPAYMLKNHLSPHHAARLENKAIDTKKIIPPATLRPLVIETAGGILVPLTDTECALDLYQTWDCSWIVVSKHYIGSINHTLLTLEALKSRNTNVLGIIFNGDNPDSERAILAMGKIPCLGKLYQEKQIDQKTIHKYAVQWQTSLSNLI